MPSDTQPADRTRIEDVLGFWLGPVHEDGSVEPTHVRRWFKADVSFDREVTDRFADLVRRAARGELNHWRTSARGALALVILCDQLTRNIYRGRPQAWDLDPKAREIALGAIDSGQDEQLRAIERAFLYMPLMHAEDVALQERSVELFRELAEQTPDGVKETLESFREHAVEHHDVVERFGRFPHRNETLGRESTEEEEAFLADGKPFG